MSSPRSLPPRPSYEQLRKQAKDLHRSLRSGDGAACQRLLALHPLYRDKTERTPPAPAWRRRSW